MPTPQGVTMSPNSSVPQAASFVSQVSMSDMLLEIRKLIVEETVSMNPAFDYEGLDEEVAQALLDLSHYGERDREHLTRYARSRANRFVWVKV
jgi:hypothetical protein